MLHHYDLHDHLTTTMTLSIMLHRYDPHDNHGPNPNLSFVTLEHFPLLPSSTDLQHCWITRRSTATPAADRVLNLTLALALTADRARISKGGVLTPSARDGPQSHGP